MDIIVNPLQQLLLIVAVMIFAILAVEVLLYFLFTAYRKPYFYPIVAIVGIGLSFVIEGSVSIESVIKGAVGGALIALFFHKVVRGQLKFPFLMMAPAFVSIALLVVYPFFFEFRLALSNLNMYTVSKWIQSGELEWVGLQNFYNVFTTSPLQTATFWQLLMRTFLWTGINVVFHVLFGLIVALLLNNPIRFRGLYRTLLVVPWAMPQVVAVLAWRGEFHPQFGFVNQLLEMVGITGVNWWSDPIPVFISCCLVNIWLGIPFMMIVFLGGLQSIPKSYYEAAAIDGASKWQQFKSITVPMLKPVVIPSVTLGTIWTFNNVNVIYLMTGQDGGNEFADILITALYKSAFTYSRFSFSAAFAMVICAILLLITFGWIKITRATDSAVV